MSKIKALVSCQNDYCATEQSLFLDMVRKWRSEPICQNCWEDGDYGEERGIDNKPNWNDLPRVELSDLSA